MSTTHGELHPTATLIRSQASGCLACGGARRDDRPQTGFAESRQQQDWILKCLQSEPVLSQCVGWRFVITPLEPKPQRNDIRNSR